MKINVKAIVEFCEKVATILPQIEHSPGVNNRFFKTDYEEFLSGTRSELEFPCMGLNFRQESSLPGSIKSVGTNSQLRMQACVIFAHKAESGNYTQNEARLDEMFECILHLYDFMETRAAGTTACNYPLIELWDMEQGVRFYSLADAEIENAVGWVMFIPLRESLIFDNKDNPLKAL